MLAATAALATEIATAGTGPAVVQGEGTAVLRAHVHAVELARAGHFDAGIALLRTLHAEHPSDVSITRDEVAVLSWAGRYAEAVELFATLPPDEPAYVLGGAAGSYRRLRRLDEALALYREGAREYANDPMFAAGEIDTLTDLGRPGEGLALAEDVLRRLSGSPQILDAAAYAAIAADEPVDALRFAQQATAVAPDDGEALRQTVAALDRMGAPHQALAFADAHPGLVADADRRRLENDDAAQMVRFGPVETASPKDRFVATDAAIARLDGLISRWTPLGPSARSDLLQARFNRMLALRDRARMPDVVREYDALRAEGVEIPEYALEAAGDAYLYLRQPEEAKRVYETIVAKDPQAFNAKLGLFRSLIALDDFDAALAMIDELDARTRKWIYLNGDTAPEPNPARARADTSVADARLDGDLLADADRRFSALAAAAPADSTLLGGLAAVYGARGWPRRAGAEYQLAHAFDVHDPGLQIGAASNDFALQDWPSAEQGARLLYEEYPENADAQALRRQDDLFNRAELRVSIDRSPSSKAGVRSGQETTLDTEILTPPIDEYWRGFVDEAIGHQHEPEGAITLRDTAAGVEYRAPDITADAEASHNSFGAIAGATNRTGAKFGALWNMDDEWQFGANAEIFANDIQLRALRNGITADSVTATAVWRESELRQISFGPSALFYSDGNTHLGVGAQYQERLYTAPHWIVDGLASFAVDHGSRAGQPYFNPKLDLAPSVGVAVTEILYRRYEFVYEHSLTITTGPYWERNYGTSFSGAVKYEQRLKTSDAFEIGVGGDVERAAYDGLYETTIDLLVDLTWRF